MAKANTTKLRALVVAHRRNTKGPFDKHLREKLLACAEQRWREGATTRQVAEELGMSEATVAYWRSRRGSTLQPVQILADEAAEPERRFRLLGPCGTVLEGVTLSEVAELWRRLA